MFDLSEMEQNLLALPDKVERAIMGYSRTAATRIQGIAQEERPWDDHTTQARERITGKCTRVENGIRIALSHGVDYGIYLEFANEKRYAVIYPTLKHEAPNMMKGLQRLFDRMGGF